MTHPTEKAAREALAALNSLNIADALPGAYQVILSYITSTSDTVKRLTEELARREQNERQNCVNWGPCSQNNERMSGSEEFNRSWIGVLTKQSAEISRLSALLEEAVGVVKPFAEFTDALDPELPDDEQYNYEVGENGGHALTCGNFRVASSFLAKMESEHG